MKKSAKKVFNTKNVINVEKSCRKKPFFAYFKPFSQKNRCISQHSQQFFCWKLKFSLFVHTAQTQDFYWCLILKTSIKAASNCFFKASFFKAFFAYLFIFLFLSELRLWDTGARGSYFVFTKRYNTWWIKSRLTCQECSERSKKERVIPVR